MATKPHRRNESTLVNVRAASIAFAVGTGLLFAHVRPPLGVLAVTLVVGVLALASTDLGIIAAVVALAVPVFAAQPVAGVLFLVAALIAVRYVGSDDGAPFLVIAFSALSALLIAGDIAVGPLWAAAAIAGYVLGAGEGAIAAAAAVVVIELAGIVLGRAQIGLIATSGSAPALLDLARTAPNLFSAEWLKTGISGLTAHNVNAVTATFGRVGGWAALLAQPAAWAAGAGLAGALADAARKRQLKSLRFAAVASGIALAAVLTAVARSLAGLDAGTVSLVVAALVSTGSAAGFVWIWDRYFPLVAPAASRPTGALSIAAEDADVDELLRLISTAEDELASRHTTTKTVMITDMKSFSRMTEEDGSMLTAKAIQRHRDLLLPVIARHGGCGKSTGGDGLVAAFDSPGSALLAAAEMQRALTAHNEKHTDERDIFVRIGVAEGEVVLDKGGRPFIGAALNLAARIMNLADGGQAFASGGVAAGAADMGVTTHCFGRFELKNISQPVEVCEILWAEGQEPIDPRTRDMSA